MSRTGRAQFGPYFDLLDLDGTNAKRFMGENRWSCTGGRSTVGDVNDDGLSDLIFGAPCAGELGPGGDEFPGTLYVVFGGAWFDQVVSVGVEELDGTNGFATEGQEPGGAFGYSPISGFDWNGDGVDDLAVAAVSVWVGPNNDAGQVFVIFGHAGIGAGGSFDLTTLDGSNGFVIAGLALLDSLGRSIAAGDFNGDGWPDLAMGATGYTMPGRSFAGRVFVVFGGPGVGSTGSFDLTTLNGTNGFVANGIAAHDVAGWAVANAGDLNDDGVDDLAIGSHADANGLEDAGQSYVLFGGPAIGQSGVVELAELQLPDGFVVNGAEPDDGTAWVTGGADVNGDGISDLAIGHRGGTAVVFGGANVGAGGVLEIAKLAWPEGVRLLGSAGYGTVVGDINDDGLAEVALPSPYASPEGRYEAGIVHVVFGHAELGIAGPVDVDALDGSNGFYVYGDQLYLRLWNTYPLGDLNRDGIGDFGVFGLYNRPDAPLVDRDHGAVYVIFGRSRFALGDLDRDGDVDASDFGSFLLCYNGSSRPPGPACPEGLDADLDNDGDVDLDDFSIFAAAYTGSL